MEKPGVLAFVIFLFFRRSFDSSRNHIMNKVIISSVVLKKFCEALNVVGSTTGYFSLCGNHKDNMLYLDGHEVNAYCIVRSDFNVSISTKKINDLDDILGLLSEQPITVAFNLGYLSIESILI